MTQSTNSIRERMQGRLEATSMFELIDLNNRSEEFVVAYWQAVEKRLRESGYAQGVSPEPTSPILPMNYEEAKKFESVYIEFGVHVGTKFGEVPIKYLTYVTDKNMPLVRYLMSPQGKRRIETNDEE